MFAGGGGEMWLVAFGVSKEVGCVGGVERPLSPLRAEPSMVSSCEDEESEEEIEVVENNGGPIKVSGLCDFQRQSPLHSLSMPMQLFDFHW